MRFGFVLLVVCLLIAQRGFAAGLQAQYLQASSAALANPHDLKLSADGKQLYVADVGHDRIAVLDAQTLDLLWHFGADHQSGTHDIDFDRRGRAYVADTHNNRVTIYRIEDSRATLLGELSESIRGPEGVLAHPNGRIYVAGAWSGNVVAYRNGSKVKELSGLSSPHDLVLAADGDIWLSDSGNHRVLLLSPQLEIKRELSQAAYDFDGVRYMDMMADGTLIAADKYNHAIKFISRQGEVLLQLGDGRPGLGANRFTTPEGVEVDGDLLWLSDSGNNRIVQYRLQRH